VTSRDHQIPTDELLGEHLNYEIDMLRETLMRFPSDKKSWDDLTITERVHRNAFIESFCTHARCLIEFFEKARGAAQYSDYDPAGIKPLSARYMQKINNQISHLLDCRTADPTRKISLEDRWEIARQIQAEVKRFIDGMKAEYRHIKVRELNLPERSHDQFDRLPVAATGPTASIKINAAGTPQPTNAIIQTTSGSVVPSKNFRTK
jgi:hypothetical protein